MLFLSFFDFARFCKGGRVPFSKQGVPYVCAPTVNGRSSHLIEAAKRGRLDQMIFFGAVDDTGADDDRPAGRDRPGVWPNVQPDA